MNRWARAAAIVILTFAGMWGAVAAGVPVRVLEQQLLRDGPDAVNARLDAQWDSTMVPLLRRASKCQPRDLALVLELRRTTNVTAFEAFVATLQTAMERCPARILRAVSDGEVAQACSAGDWADAFPSVPLERVVRRRIARVKAIVNPALTAKANACIAAYQTELLATKRHQSPTRTPTRSPHTSISALTPANARFAASPRTYPSATQAPALGLQPADEISPTGLPSSRMVSPPQA